MSAYREIRAGDIGVTIITEGRTVWVAATVGGKCRSAFGMYHGPVRSLLTGEDLDTPKRWRPCYWRTNAAGGAKYGDYVHMWWTWLSYIVNEVRLGHVHAGTSRKLPNHHGHSPSRVAGRLAERIRQHLEATYRNG